MANSDDSDLQQYWLSICERERQAKVRNARILRELESLDRRFNVIEIRAKKIVELKDWYVAHLQRRNPDWKPDFMPKTSNDSLFTEPGGILAKLSTFRYLDSEPLRGPYAVSLESEQPKPMESLKSDIELLRERLDRMAQSSSYDMPFERLTIEPQTQLQTTTKSSYDNPQERLPIEHENIQIQSRLTTNEKPFERLIAVAVEPQPQVSRQPEKYYERLSNEATNQQQLPRITEPVRPTETPLEIAKPKPLHMPTVTKQLAQPQIPDKVESKLPEPQKLEIPEKPQTVAPRINFGVTKVHNEEAVRHSSSSSESSLMEPKLQPNMERKLTSSSINEYQRVENSDSSEPPSDRDMKPSVKASLGYESLLGIARKVTAHDNLSLNSDVDDLDRQIASKAPEDNRRSSIKISSKDPKPMETRPAELIRKLSIVQPRISEKKDEKEELLSQLFPPKTALGSSFNLKLIGSKNDSDSDVEIPITKKGSKVALADSDDDDFFN